jgi:hypothetical protein
MDSFEVWFDQIYLVHSQLSLNIIVGFRRSGKGTALAVAIQSISIILMRFVNEMFA